MVDAAFAAGGPGLANPITRRDDSAATTGPARPTAPQALNSPQPPAADGGLNVDVATATDPGQLSVLDRVSATQQARQAVNQVQDSLIEQRNLASEAENAPAAERAGLEAQQVELQSARTQRAAEDEALQAGTVPEIADIAANLTGQGLIGPADPLPSATDLSAGIDSLGEVQSALDDAEIALQTEFTQSLNVRLQNPAGSVPNASEAEALLARVLEQENELPLTSNAVDDAQRQQTLNLLSV